MVHIPSWNCNFGYSIWPQSCGSYGPKDPLTSRAASGIWIRSPARRRLTCKACCSYRSSEKLVAPNSQQPASNLFASRHCPGVSHMGVAQTGVSFMYTPLPRYYIILIIGTRKRDPSFLDTTKRVVVNDSYRRRFFVGWLLKSSDPRIGIRDFDRELQWKPESWETQAPTPGKETKKTLHPS